MGETSQHQLSLRLAGRSRHDRAFCSTFSFQTSLFLTTLLPSWLSPPSRRGRCCCCRRSAASRWWRVCVCWMESSGHGHAQTHTPLFLLLSLFLSESAAQTIVRIAEEVEDGGKSQGGRVCVFSFLASCALSQASSSFFPSSAVADNDADAAACKSVCVGPPRGRRGRSRLLSLLRPRVFPLLLLLPVPVSLRRRRRSAALSLSLSPSLYTLRPSPKASLSLSECPGYQLRITPLWNKILHFLPHVCPMGPFSRPDSISNFPL